ncbi:MAG: crossover junction endodeoxyribonuclease RuvC, partial [Desulfomonilaceae bacterium]
MLILGVDPGTTTTGYGIVRKNGSSPTYVTSGVIRAGNKKAQPQKLLGIYNSLGQIILEYHPTVMVVESLFHGVNSQSLIKLGQARGVVLLLGAV